MISESLYPPSPAEVAGKFQTSHAYRLRVVLVLISLLLFLAIYLSFVAASGYLVYWALTGPTSKRHAFGFFDFILLLGALMLFLFFLKGLFKRSRPDMSKLVEVTEKEQPKLFAFVRKLCADAGTQFPRAIYLSHEVNAAVFYPRSLLSLIRPVRKNLLIGVGLVNLLNLSELKAVLAHELGHFAQSSMKLGQYVYVANQVIYDMAFGRDFWDSWLAKWRSVDPRLSFPAWIITAIVWVLRRFLRLVFRAVNVANLSLSRQMEFNADLHAVSLTGSDALISGLWKTERGGIAMQRALAQLHSLAEHGKFSDDLFFHQSAELDRLDEVLAEQGDGSAYVKSLCEPYRYGEVVHFHEGDDHAPSMWSSHPANREREVNAKKTYVRVEPVVTSAWRLLASKKGLRKRLTRVAYEEVLRVPFSPKQVLPAAEVLALAKEEEEERKQAAHYHGLYENRIIELGDIDKLIRSLDEEDPERDPSMLRDKAAAWTGEKLAAFMKGSAELHADIATLAAVVDDKSNVKQTFELRGEIHPTRDAERLLKQFVEQSEKLQKRIKNADRAIFRHFYVRSGSTPEAREELVRRYRFLVALEELIVLLKPQERGVGAVLQLLQENRDLSREQFGGIVHTLDCAYNELDRVAERCRKLALPKLSHIEEGATVASFVIPERIIDPRHPERLEGAWIMQLVKQFDQVIGRLRKLHYKNLGVLLKLQEELDPALYGDGAQSRTEAADTAKAAMEDEGPDSAPVDG